MANARARFLRWVTTLSVAVSFLGTTWADPEEPPGDPVPRTDDGRHLANEVANRANASYYRFLKPGSPGFEARYVVKRGDEDLGRVRIRAGGGRDQPEVVPDARAQASAPAALPHHGSALAAPLCGPFLLTEATFGHPVWAVRDGEGWRFDTSGGGEIQGVVSDVCTVASDFLRTRAVGRLADGREIEVVRKGKASHGVNYLTYQSWIERQPDGSETKIEYAWRWERRDRAMFVALFVAKETHGDSSVRIDLELEDLTLLGREREAPPARETEERPVDRPPPMTKYVSTAAHFVLYQPQGWQVTEGMERTYWWVSLVDPATGCRVVSCHGVRDPGEDVRVLARNFLGPLQRRLPGLRLDETRVARDGSRAYARGGFGAPSGAAMDVRCWFSRNGPDFTYARIETPAGTWEARKKLMLSLLGNVTPLKNVFQTVEARPLPLRTFRLGDGSATFLLPVGWQVVPLGPSHFLARDPAEKYAFMVASARAISPRLGVRPAGVPVSDFLAPHQALFFFAREQGLLRGARVAELNRRPDLARYVGATYRAGPVVAEDFTYAFPGRHGPAKGFTLGISFGSNIQASFLLWHMTATAPAAEFPTMAATFKAMATSYRIDETVARRYVEEGARRLAAMVRRTSEIVARNAQEIRHTMNMAYQERMASQDYIDYLRTRYIRGEADWVSGHEGGTIYRTDHWGIQNRTAGGRWDGQPFNYYNFRGGAGGYGDLVEVNSRELFERHIAR